MDMVDPKSQTQNSDDLTKQETPKRAKLSDFISPYLEPLYELFVDDFIKKYNIDVPDSFWFVFSLFIFSVLVVYSKLDYQASVFLLLLALLILLAKNRKIIAKKFFPKQSDAINSFIDNIQTKNLDETKKFIQQNYRQLSTNSQIKLLESKFNNNPAIYQSIFYNQIIYSELIEHIIKNNLIPNMGIDIFCDYLLGSVNTISFNYYEFIKNSYKDNDKVIKTLNVCYPFYLKSHPIFNFFANIRISLKESMNYGNGNGVIALFSLILVIFALSTQPQSINSSKYIIPTEPLSAIFFVINLVMGFFIAIGFITIIINFCFRWLLRRYRGFLYLVSPGRID